MRLAVRLGLCLVAAIAWLSLVTFEKPIKSQANEKIISKEFRVLSFNILQSGGNAANVGFYNKAYGGSRMDEIVEVIKDTNADVVGLQELYNAGGKLVKAMGKGWRINGTILSKHPIEVLDKGDQYFTVCRIRPRNRKNIIVINTHWWPIKYGPDVIGKLARKSALPKNIEKFKKEVSLQSVPAKGKRGYQRTVNAIKKYLDAGETVFVTGDFNEASDLDWTEKYESQGVSRVVNKDAGQAVVLSVPWIGSKKIRQTGLKDAYRQVFPDEIKKTGNTWTAIYPEKTPGRQPYSHQVLSRIDFVYFGGKGVKVKDAAVVGEDKDCEIIYKRRWPSDHRAVLGVFELK